MEKSRAHVSHFVLFCWFFSCIGYYIVSLNFWIELVKCYFFIVFPGKPFQFFNFRLIWRPEKLNFQFYHASKGPLNKTVLISVPNFTTFSIIYVSGFKQVFACRETFIASLIYLKETSITMKSKSLLNSKKCLIKSLSGVNHSLYP